MKYLITRTYRTSVYGERYKPCEEAFKDSYTYVDYRTCKTFEEFDDRLPQGGDKWESKGTNHRLVSIGIARDMGSEEGWFIELNDLSSLHDFIKKYGELVIGPSYLNNDIMSIEIYNGYRE